MAINDTVLVTLSGSDGTRVSGSSGETGATRISVNQNIAAASTNQSVSIAFTAANLQSIVMLANQNCTVKTNSTGAPDNTFNLIAGIPLMWVKSAGYFTNPFSANVTIMYATCTPATILQIAALTN